MSALAFHSAAIRGARMADGSDDSDTIDLAESLAAIASEFAHDAANLVLQLIAGYETLEGRFDPPLTSREEIETLVRRSENLQVLAHDLDVLVRNAKSDPA